jgi:hypothetical protein
MVVSNEYVEAWDFLFKDKTQSIQNRPNSGYLLVFHDTHLCVQNLTHRHNGNIWDVSEQFDRDYVELCSKMDHVSYNYNSVLQGFVCYYNKHQPLVSAYITIYTELF